MKVRKIFDTIRVMAKMNKKYIRTNIYFVVPIALWFAFYGTMIVNGGTFANLFIIMLFLGILPYSILWFFASRFPDKSSLCKSGSVEIFTATALMAVKYLFFTRNAEEAMGLFVLPVLALGVIGYLILLLPLAAVIMYIRKRLRRKTEIEQQ
jgi:hypothetical protein